jgi:hypothetical protein
LLPTLFVSCCLATAQTREEKVRADRAKVEAEGFWIYNDIDEAYRTAEASGKPILVSLRCLPCEECVKLDDDLIDNDPVVRPLLEKFVCVRIVGTNGLDLKTFQYDTDQSFAMFMLNADKTVYGRFGTRSHRTEWLGDVSIEGMAEALKGALALHAQYPANRQSLLGKQGEPLEYASPEQYPSLKDKYTDRLNYEGDVVKSCIHCHQIGDARREIYWSRSQPIPEELLFPYPHPKSLGLVLDPTRRARVKEITPNSPAAESALKPGDDILRIDGQPILSMADVQWVLHQAPSTEVELKLTVQRDAKIGSVTLSLPTGWRRLDNPRWRVASWGIGRMMTGGMRLQAMTEQERQEAGIQSRMALRATHVGKYGPHATARQAGLREDDIVVEYNGQSDLLREADLFAYANENLKPGDRVEVKYLRSGQMRTATLPIQR